jgi:hypothetical protein
MEISHEEIIDALSKWVERHPEPNREILEIAGESLSPSGILAAVKEFTKAGKAFLHMLEMGTEVMPIEQILSNLSGENGPENFVRIRARYTIPLRGKKLMPDTRNGD